MTKKAFINHTILSSLLTAIAIVAIVGFSVIMFKQYSPPNEDNTSMMSATVTEVYVTTPRVTAEIAISGGESLVLVSPYGVHNLCSTIGYNIEQLANLLEGNVIEYRRMNDLPWVVEIYVGDTQIDNTKLTTQQIHVTRMVIVIVGLIMIFLTMCGQVTYVKTKYKCYLKVKKKQERKAKRKLKKFVAPLL